MKIDYDGLKSSLSALSRGRATHQDLLLVVRVSRAIVEAYLKVRASTLGYLYRDQGLSETDLAYDCIAEMFRSEDGRSYPKVDSFASSLSAPIGEMPPVELFIALRAFLVRIARAHLAGLFYLSDPAGGRIYRNIRDCVKRHSGFRLIDATSTLYLAVQPERPATVAGAYPPEDLERELFARAGPERSTGGLLEHAHGILAADTRYGGRVRLFDLVQMFRKLIGADHADDAGESIPPVEGLAESDILFLREKCLNGVKEKIFLTYLGKGKLTRKEATALCEAVAGVIDDWIAGSDGDRSLHDRLNDHLPSSPADYAERYRGKLEYLVKTAREEMAAMLSREL